MLESVDLQTAKNGQNGNNGFRAVGHSEKRIDGADKVTGLARFAADLNLPGLLHARPVLSLYAHARIVSINTEAASKVPGVVRVVTADDLPIRPEKSESRKRNPLAKGEVLFYGQPVAIVLGETEAAARDGAELVEVEYEPLPVVTDIFEAMKPNSPLVQQKPAHGADEEAQMHNAAAGSASNEEQIELPGNVSNHSHMKRGDVEAAFKEAAAISEHTFRVPAIYQSYIETQSCTAAPDPLGGMVLYTSTQAGFYCRDEVAGALGISPSKVKVVTMMVGGAFGAKFVVFEPMTAALAKLTGRPVRFSFYRMEDLQAANPVQYGIIEMKMGAKADGTICAMKAKVYFDSGIYPGSPFWAASMLGMCYRIPNFDIEAFEILTHKVNNGAYRAPGAPQVTFATEVAVDELAHQLGRDPIEFRLQNCVVEGDVNNNDRQYPRIGLKECLETLQRHPLYQKRNQKGAGEGIGVAIGGWGGGLEPASALCRLENDGTFTIPVGVSDISGVSTSFKLIAAEVLGLSPDKVNVVLADTDSAPYAGGSGGSKTLFTVGAAVKKAAEDAAEQIKKIAAAELEAAPQDIELKDGKASVVGVPSKSVDLITIAKRSFSSGKAAGPVLGNGSSSINKSAPGFTAHLAHVKVDEDTGEVKVIDYVAIQDVGKAINPGEVEGQMHGGVTQGLGWALYEQLVYDNSGTLISGSFMDYALQNSEQTPNIEAILVEVPSEEGPFGARGVGEPPVVPGGGAVSNAIFDATGARVTSIPAIPQRVLEAIQAKK
ncbi:MAG TPA: xanthine dehydrogenase family protein molybdopterin-binding subunit [Chloroflexia bacterium]|nr:xanthine dehydrogenase family protein molybdopterin-binding subunit [Chloroflexia bacterium]